MGTGTDETTTNRVERIEGAIVLGMGRSGTSMTTGALRAAGFWAGADDELMRADPSQPAGYFENSALYDVHERILEELGATWFLPPTADATATMRAAQLPRVRAVLERLRTGADGRPIVVKDPRVNVLLDLWGELIDGRLHPVLSVRDPVEVALSLESRDGTPTAMSLAIWELHNRLVLRYLDGRRVTVVPYAALHADPGMAALVAADVMAQLDPALAVRVTTAAASGTVRRDLHRSRADASRHGEYLTAAQAQLWRYLAGLPVGGQVLSVPAELRDAPTDAPRRLAESEAQRQQQLREIVVLSRELSDSRQQCARSEAACATAEAGRATAEAACATAESELEGLRQRVAATVGELEQMTARAAAAEETVAALRSSTSWRATQPLRTLKTRLDERVLESRS